MRYQPYKTQVIDGMSDNLRKVGLIGRKDKVTLSQSLIHHRQLLKHAGARFGVQLEDWIAMTEHHYLTSDRFTIFPESTDILDTILRAKLNVTDFDSILPPANVFTVMIPEGYKTPAGVPLKSFLVQWDQYSSSLVRYNKLSNDYNLNATFAAPKNEAYTSTSSYLDVICPAEQGNYLRSSHNGEETLHLLALADEQEIFESRAPESIKVKEPSEVEAQQMRAMTKIALGMAVFDSAYDDFLTKGLPQVKMKKPPAGANLNNAHVVGGKTASTGAKAKSGHIRSFHFRQLRDARYYQGEHASKPVGSRYVPVKEAWIGDEIDSHTTNHNTIG
jgi:hypothetical protein